MRVTSVSLSKDLIKKPGSNLLAFGHVILDDCLMINFVRVVRGFKGRMWVCMPSRLNNAGQHKDCVHPITREIRKHIEDEVLREYNRT